MIIIILSDYQWCPLPLKSGFKITDGLINNVWTMLPMLSHPLRSKRYHCSNTSPPHLCLEIQQKSALNICSIDGWNSDVINKVKNDPNSKLLPYDPQECEQRTEETKCMSCNNCLTSYFQKSHKPCRHFTNLF